MELEVVLVVEHFLAQVTRELGANLVLELEVVAASARDAEHLLTQRTLVLSVLVFDVQVQFTLFYSIKIFFHFLKYKLWIKNRTFIKQISFNYS